MGKVQEGMAGDSLEVESGGVVEVHSGGRVHVESGGTIEEDAGGAILGRAVLTTYSPDIGTAGSAYVVTPFAGKVERLDAVIQKANAGTKTVLTSKIDGSGITHPAWEVAVSGAAGTAYSSTPSAGNAVAAGSVIEVIFDGGSSATTPAVFSVTVRRSS